MIVLVSKLILLHEPCIKFVSSSEEPDVKLTLYDINSPAIQRAVEKQGIIFAVGHVLRYSPHNLLLKRLVCDDEIIGEVIAVEHTEPVSRVS